MSTISELEQLVFSESDKATIIYLEELDKICTRCLTLPREELLCSGCRPAVNVEASKFYSKLSTQFIVCEKRQAIETSNKIRNNLEISGIPKSIWSDYLNKPVASVSIVNNTSCIQFAQEIHPKLSYLYMEPNILMRMFRYLIAGNLAGYKCKFLHLTQAISVYKNNLDQIYYDYVEDCDWLVVVGFGLKRGADYILESFESALEGRITLNKPTTFLLERDMVGRNEQSQRLIQEIKQWKKW